MNRPRTARVPGLAQAAVLIAALLASACAMLSPPGSPAADGSSSSSVAVATAAAQAASASAGQAAQAATAAAQHAQQASAPNGQPRPAPPGAAQPPQPPGQPKPFAEIVKDAKQTAGLFALWRKDEKVWIEVAPDQFDKPYFLAVNLSRGIGEHRLHGGAMGGSAGAGDSYVVTLRRIGQQVQLVAKNTRFVARPGSPEERAVRRGFSDSLLAAAPVASQPHPERKSVLVEANALLLADIGRGAHAIERAYRNAFQFDAKNSYIVEAKTRPEQTTIDVSAHYAQARIPLPSPTPGATPFFAPPSVIEDPRSLFLGFIYSFTPLPEQPMRPRIADSRLGHFRTALMDFSDERRVDPHVHYVNRWRVEKKDPAAALSEPVKPIVFWLDHGIPEKYRGPIAEGILEWNKAFERIGIRDAIQVKVQPADADFDGADTLHASVRWMTSATPSFAAIGPSQVDPRTGEILDADIGIDASVTRLMRFYRAEAIGEAHRPMYDPDSGALRADALGIAAAGSALCSYAEQAAREYGFALAMLEARGEIDAEGPDAERFVAEYLKDVMMHETGHTLGLMHNFRGSTVYSAAQLADPSFTTEHGISGSVMDYHPFNLALAGEKQGSYSMRSLGPYDYWAIEYAYRPIAPEREAEDLGRVAARSKEPDLAYASDSEAAEGIDPEVNQFDLGSDTLAYYRKRLLLSRELWQRLEKRNLREGESYDVLRRRFLTGFNQISLTMGLAAKYVGGVTTLRDHAGSERAPLKPVAPARQREALALIADGLFKVDSFRVSPGFLQRLADDPLRREHSWPPKSSSVLALPDMIFAVQRDVLARLMSPTVAQRLLANELQVLDVADALSLGELYERLQESIWAETDSIIEVSLLRRNLQREHLRRMAAALIAPTAGLPADARALHRQNAQRLRERLARVVDTPKLSREARAHYAESLDTLTETLKAPLVRGGV